MSIVDDTRDVERPGRDGEGRKRRDGGLWHTVGLPGGTKHKGAKGGRHDQPRPIEPPVFEHAGGDDLWKTRIDLVVSAGLSTDEARRGDVDDHSTRSEATFEAFRHHCGEHLRPVLESSVAMLGEWGLTAAVTETLRDVPTRLPRSFDLALSIDRFGRRGPGRLTITATEACDFVKVKLKVGPTAAGEVDEHVGTTVARDLSDALVGGLVATLVERIFSE